MSSFLSPGAALLRSQVAPIADSELLSTATQNDITRLRTIAAAERTPERMLLVGLAAPQVGINKAIILVDESVTEQRTGWAKELTVYINPQITASSKKIVEGREGCFSVDSHVAGIVPRAENITMQAFDEQGQRVTREFAGFTARIVQHEIDHLYGVRFPDRVGPIGVLHWVEQEQYPEYRLKWRDWPIRFSWDQWLAMKEGKPIAPQGHSMLSR